MILIGKTGAILARQRGTVSACQSKSFDATLSPLVCVMFLFLKSINCLPVPSFCSSVP